MQVTLKFISFYRRLVGTDQMSVDLPEGTTVSGVLDFLDKEIEGLCLDKKRIFLMLNDKHAPLEAILKEGDVLRFLPVLGGG